MFKLRSLLLLISCVIIFLTSCNTMDKILGKNFVLNVKVKNESNNNFAFESDIIAVKNNDLNKKISQITNLDWFSETNKEVQELKNSKDVTIFKVYTVPENTRKSIVVSLPFGCEHIYLFNRYHSQLKSYPLKISTHNNVSIVFNQNQIDIKEAGRTKQERNELETIINEEESNDNV